MNFLIQTKLIYGWQDLHVLWRDALSAHDVCKLTRTSGSFFCQKKKVELMCETWSERKTEQDLENYRLT